MLRNYTKHQSRRNQESRVLAPQAVPEPRTPERQAYADNISPDRQNAEEHDLMDVGEVQQVIQIANVQDIPNDEFIFEGDQIIIEGIQNAAPVMDWPVVRPSSPQPSTSRALLTTPNYTPESDAESSVSGTPREYRLRRTGKRVATGRELFPMTPGSPQPPGRKKTAKTVVRMSFAFRNIRTTKAKCFLCDAATANIIPRAAVVDIWVNEDILIPIGSVCCSLHIGEDHALTQDAIMLMLAHELKERFHATQEDLFFLITSFSAQCRKKWTLNFEDGHFSDYEVNALTGLSLTQVNELHTLIQPKLAVAALPMSTMSCTAAFLMKLRLNVSQKVIGVFFGSVKQQRISEALELVRTALDERFVPRHLGCDHVSREDYIAQWGTDLCKTIFDCGDNCAVAILDGTYIYIQKSQQYTTQRRTYSAHKYRNLIKFMMVVAPNGNILDAAGPFLADGRNNDANILNNMSLDPVSFMSFFKEGDLFI